MVSSPDHLVGGTEEERRVTAVERLEEDELPQHLYRWLESTQRRVASELDAVMSDEIKRIGFRHLRVLQLIPSSGSRQQELAERALMTKQAMADFVDALESDGLLARSPDPTDGRAWVITRTAAGDRVNADLEAAIGAVEFELARAVGVTRYRTFMDVLRELGHDQI
jgi:DNA-binding MarR family transcriptional regulator